jgi:hypothetical protein
MMKQMKKIKIALMVLMIGSQIISGQSRNAGLESFRSDVLAKYSEFFTQSDLDEKGQLRLAATGTYNNLSLSEKTEIMNALPGFWRESLIIVHFGSGRELWTWSAERGSAKMIDAWDLNPEPVAAVTETDLPEVAKHPWFFYIGGAQQMDSNKNLSGALNIRTGFFMLKNKLDLAVSLTESLTGNLEDESASLTTGIGIGSKYYFPLTKSSISPNLGAELAVTLPSGGKAAFTPSLLAGVSWFVGPGCLDAGVRVGSSSTMMFGYTLIPRLKTGK